MGRIKIARQVTESEVSALYAEFVLAVQKATGKNGNRQNFYKFKVMHQVTEPAELYLEHYRAGRFENAMSSIQEALTTLDDMQRYYCAMSVEYFFRRLVSELKVLSEKGQLDKDIFDGVDSKMRRFSEVARHIRLDKSITLESASELYWALYDSIVSAAADQARRERNRADRAAKAASREAREVAAERRRQADARAEADRQTQLALEAERRARRERQTGDMKTQLEALFA